MKTICKVATMTKCYPLSGGWVSSKNHWNNRAAVIECKGGYIALQSYNTIVCVLYRGRLHEMVTDIVDSLYNVGLSMKDRFSPEYKAIYDFFGADYFSGVLDDMSALDKQVVDPYKVNELLGSYLDRLS